MDFRQLRYFVAVAEELSFTRAARRVRVAQPTLSQQIRMLEKELCVALFTRSKRRVELTHAGRVFLGVANRLLVAETEAIIAVQSAAAGKRGQLVVVCGPTAAYAGLLAVLEPYRRASPLVEVQLLESAVPDAVLAVEESKADVGLVVPYFDSPVLNREIVLEVPLLAALPKSHALATARRVSLKRLARDPFVLFGQRRGSGFYERVLAICHSAGFTPRVLESMEHIHTLLYLVGAGYAVSLVPASLDAAVHADVVLVPLEEAATLEMAMIWRSDQRSPAVQGFLETVRAWCDSRQIGGFA